MGLKPQKRIASLDIGSNKIVCLIGYINANNDVCIRGVSNVKSKGIQNYKIVDKNLAVESILKAIKKAEEMAGFTVNSITINISSSVLESSAITGTILLNGREIEERDIANFSTQQLEYALSKWFEMYSDYTDALDTYFDTISNKYIMPSIQIKNFVSTIDALSENCIIEENKDEKEIEKRKSLEKILEKTREVLKESELNQIRNAIWGKKKNKKPKIPLEPRFNCLLTSISSLLPDEINEEFVKKIVNTRNNITHPKAQKLPAFSAVEYDNASYLLTKVIRAYLLNTLSFNSEIIKKIITF